MSAPVLTDEEVREEVARLVEANRTRCLWFAPLDYMPATDEERILTLRDIETYGDRATFVRARELRKWLSQSSNGK